MHKRTLETVSARMTTLVNKTFLAWSVRSILGCIEVAEPEYVLIFFKLALVFEILSVTIFSEKCK